MQMTLNRAVGAALLVLSVAACKKKEEPEQELNPAPVTARPRILHEIPIIATSRQIDTTGSTDAERNTWLVRGPYDSVLAYYRRLLPTMGWAVMSDQGDSLETNLYLRKSTYALWLHVERRAEDTMYMLITSAADSTTPVMPTPR